MSSKIVILCLLLSLLTAGCGTPKAPATKPTVPDTFGGAATSEPETTPQESGVTVPSSQVSTTVETPPLIPDPVIPDTTAATLPLLSAPDPTPGITLCGHSYQLSFAQAPTCEQAGYQNYRCQKCGDLQQEFSLPLGHSYLAATCISPECCSRCGMKSGNALGHHYEDGHCIRCGEKDPSLRIITIQVKDTKNVPVDGVTVELRIADALHSSAISSNGQVRFTIKDHTGSYKLLLKTIPEGYRARKDCYLYQSDSGTIVLDIIPVVYSDDHSKAAYKVGATMGEFTITDVDGKSYQLTKLLQEKKLVILNFWYYNCVPCKAEFPFLNSIYQRYHEDIELLALNHYDSEAKIKQLQSEMELSFPLAAEQLGMQQGFGIQSYPVTVFIGCDGRILYIQKDIGFQSEAELDSLVRQMIGK